MQRSWGQAPLMSSWGSSGNVPTEVGKLSRFMQLMSFIQKHHFPPQSLPRLRWHRLWPTFCCQWIYPQIRRISRSKIWTFRLQMRLPFFRWQGDCHTHAIRTWPLKTRNSRMCTNIPSAQVGAMKIFSSWIRNNKELGWKKVREPCTTVPLDWFFELSEAENRWIGSPWLATWHCM